MSHNHNNAAGCCHSQNDEDSHSSKGSLSLLSYIKVDDIVCLNERESDSCKKIFRSWNERFEDTFSVVSDSDAELLFNVPFTASVKLKSVVIIGDDNDAYPSELRVYKNNANLNFDDACKEPDQVLKLNQDCKGASHYVLKACKFSNVSNISLFFNKNFSNEDSLSTKITFIALFGEYLAPFRQQVTICSYEQSANPCDHQTKLYEVNTLPTM